MRGKCRVVGKPHTWGYTARNSKYDDLTSSLQSSQTFFQLFHFSCITFLQKLMKTHCKDTSMWTNKWLSKTSIQLTHKPLSPWQITANLSHLSVFRDQYPQLHFYLVACYSSINCRSTQRRKRGNWRCWSRRTYRFYCFSTHGFPFRFIMQVKHT